MGYPTDSAVQVDLGEGKRGVVESLAPMAVESAPGQRIPVDLSLIDMGGWFEPRTPVVGTRIPKQLSAGVALGGTGVSVTPVDGSGTALDGPEGAVDGASVIYSNTQTDMDTVIKPTTDGFLEDSILRGVDSPQQLSFRVGLPAGASLEQAQGSGFVQVLDEGSVIAAVRAPSARDAAGTAVPVSMSLSGNTLILTIDHPAGTYDYPIEADPEVVDTSLKSEPGSWAFGTDNSSSFYGICGLYCRIANPGGAGWEGYLGGQYGFYEYPTQGESHIYAFKSTEAQSNPSSIRAGVRIEGPGLGKESGEALLPASGEEETTVCPSSCTPEAVTPSNKHNGAFIEVYSIESARNEFATYLVKSEVKIEQEKGPSASFDTTDMTLGGSSNAMFPGTWASTTSSSPGIVGVKAFDPGIGVQKEGLSSPGKPGWGFSPKESPENGCNGSVQCNECYEAECSATKAHGAPLAEYLDGTGELPEGEDTIEAKVEDAAGLSATAVAGKIKVDNAPPHGIILTGLPSNHGTLEIGEATHQLKVEATDGSGTTPSSGIASIKLSINGESLGEPEGGECPEGPCTASREWTINGTQLGAGEHKLTVTVTDKAGNVAKEEVTLKVHHATPVAVGPGSVNPQSGEFSINATDVSISSPSGPLLTVARSYRSRHSPKGGFGPLGWQWTLSVGGEEGIIKLANGSVTLKTASGGEASFTSNGSTTLLSPSGDSNLALSEVKNGKGELAEYVLEDVADAATTRFTSLSGPTGSLWEPSKQEGPLVSQTVIYTYQTVEGVTEPTFALAPAPAGVSCGGGKEAKELKPGCRGLTFEYAKETTAKGEAPSEWGEHKNYLKAISYTAYNPSSKAMATTAVAQYAYDKEDRLRAEWNPQISPALKTTYGYNSGTYGGSLRALTLPGQESWAFNYGTNSAEPYSGDERLLSVTRASVSAALWNGEVLKNTVAPTLSSSSPVIGTTLKVASNGTWSNGPIAYSYSWGRCNAEGKECTVILGAVNQSYTPQVSDAGYRLVVNVTAISAGGAVVASSTATSTVPLSAPKYSLSFGSSGTGAGQFKEPGRDAIDSSGDVWVTDDANNRIDEFTSSGAFIKTLGFGVSNGEVKFETCTSSCRAGIAGSGNGQFNGPWGIAVNQVSGNVYVTDQANYRVDEFTTAGAFVRTFGSAGTGPGQFGVADGIAVEPATGNVWVADFSNDRMEVFSGTGQFKRSLGTTCTGGTAGTPTGVAFVGPLADVSDYSGKCVQRTALSGEYWEGEFALVGEPFEINSNLATGEIDETDLDGKIDEYNLTALGGIFVGSFGTKGTGSGQFESPTGLAVNASGNTYVVDNGNSRIQEWTPTYSTNNPLPEAPSVGSSAVTTIEYNVPLSGTGLPTMTESEVAKWGQKDDPTEAMAIFPPDSPQGWPTGEYKRATIHYADVEGRSVNTVTPGGGTSTAEYNTCGDVVRTLSPDNRAAALKEGAKSAEVAKLLDTESTYNETGSEPGTELLSTLGPTHTVELTNGTQTEARAHTVYSYDEGAPSEGGPYRLLTKVTDGAQIAGKEEAASVRSTKTSYDAQDNLGWKLRKPTSVTDESSGIDLTHSMFYQPQTGDVTETRMPAAGVAGEEPGYSLQLQFGKAGTESGQLKEPQGIAVGASGNEYVLDTGNNRVEEFNVKGEFVRTFGSEQLKGPRGIAVDPKGNVWVANTGANKIDAYTSTGTYKWAVGGEEILKNPQGLASDAKGNIWVADTGDNRVVEYEEGLIKLKPFGTAGAGEEQFKEPQDIAVGAEGDLYVVDTGNERIDEYSSAAKHIQNFGKEGSGNGQFKSPHGIATDSSGDVWVADSGNNRIQELSSAGVFMNTFGKEGSSEGKLKAPQGIAIDSEGDEWVADTANSNVQEWNPLNGSGYGSGTPSPHDTQTIYYTAGANSKAASCGEHPEWAGLLCQTQPAAQPEASLPKLQVTTTTYNMWDEPETITNTSGTTTRTTTNSYDAAGRLKTTTTTSTVGTALPTVTYGYAAETGALITQSTTAEGKTKTITSAYNKLGQLETYTDADANIATYEYDIDGRTHKASDGKGTQTYTYNENGLLSELVDSSAEGMKFTATYDVEGNMLSEGYPNGMSANYTYNSTDTATNLEYLKTTHCTENCKWFTDAVVPSIHGQWLSQTSTLAKQAYAYDAAGRLTQVQNTPVGKGCMTHIYAYDEDTNRTSLTTREPNSKGECATEGGTVEKHTYDTADRLTDSGIAYNTFGNIAALSATDAGGSELKSSYYVDDQLQSQTQKEQTIGYNLDPAGRTRETVSTGKPVIADIISHYAGPGNSPAWTTNTSSETTRNIPGINGPLAAVQNNLETPVLQLPNLHGDIIATAYKSETATALASKADTSEFGVPTTSLPPKYSWLGALELPTELPSGIVAMGARSYVPLLGRFLQPDPIPGGSANAYSYTFGDPINSADPTGAYTATAEEWAYNGSSQIATAAAEARAAEIAAARAIQRAAEEAAARVEAEEGAQEASWSAYWAAGPHMLGEGEEEWGEEEEWYEEEGEYEYASYKLGGESGEGEAHIEPALLLQPLKSNEVSGSEDANTRDSISICEPGSEGPCARYTGGVGPGAHCRHGCPSHHRHSRHGEEKQNIEACGILGGMVGGTIGGIFGDLPGGAVGSYGGQKAAEAACRAA